MLRARGRRYGWAFGVGSWPAFRHSGLKGEDEYSPVGVASLSSRVTIRRSWRSSTSEPVVIQYLLVRIGTPGGSIMLIEYSRRSFQNSF